MTLSDDARALFTAWFRWGEKTSVKIGGKHANSVLSVRGQAAIDELVAAGCVSVQPFDTTGRMLYTSTEKAREVRPMTLREMNARGDWSPTMANPRGRR